MNRIDYLRHYCTIVHYQHLKSDLTGHMKFSGAHSLGNALNS